jgi:serine/threonine-protein kinase
MDAPRTRRLARDVAIVLGVAAAGFVAVWLWIVPAPVGGSDGMVPQVVGEDVAGAEETLAALGYRVRVDAARPNADAPRGTIIAQDPPAGLALQAGRVVTIVPSAGPVEALVPELVGLDVALASRILGAAGLKVGTVDTVLDRSRAAGIVLGSRPSTGAGRVVGSTVDLIVTGELP